MNRCRVCTLARRVIFLCQYWLSQTANDFLGGPIKPNKIWRWFQPVSFQIIWFLAILGGNTLLPAVILLLACHLLLSPQRRQDLLLLPLALLGFIIDLVIMYCGFYSFDEWPYWLFFLWFGFVQNFGHSLSFLRKLKVLYLVPLGALGGCYAYWASWKLGAVEWPQGETSTLIVIASVWALLVPAVIKLDQQIRSTN